MSRWTLDELTSLLQSQTGLSFEKARAVAEQNMGRQSPEMARHATEPARQGTDRTPNPSGREKGEQTAIKNSALSRGAFVYELSQARATNQTSGLPDLYLVWPERALWWEVKSPTGVLSQPQARFLAQCVANGTLHGVGTHADFLNWCAEHGVRP